MAKKQIATFLGTNPGLSIASEYAYAFSGAVTVNNASVECLKFTSGKKLIVAQFSQAIDYTAIGNGKFTGFTIKLKGLIVATNYEATQTAGTNENNGPQVYQFVIPPFTEVITIGSTDSAADNPFFHTIVGRVYA